MSLNRSLSSQSQYCTIHINPNSTAADVCNAVARKRNLLYTEDEYELVMCDGDGEQSYETILGAEDQPHQFQQSAAKHGHLGDFHFVFRKVNDDTGSEADDADSDADSETDMFPTQSHVKHHGKYPAAWMEKRGKNHRAWRKRYFVLIDNELLYYKRRDVYEQNKDPIARIELVNPPGIIKILPPETIRKNHSITTLFCFDIHTPKRVYSLRIDNYNDMIFWVKKLSRRNEPNELIDGLDALVHDSEHLHSNDDEQVMEQFSTLEAILEEKDATDAYMKYLQSNHNEEFIHFWLDLKKYLNDYESSSSEVQERFAVELYEKYIASGGKYQLSEIKSKHRLALKTQIEDGIATLEMFDDIKNSVFDHLNRDSYIFFNSSEYFRFIVTYKHHGNDKDYEWVDRFEDRIESDNRERQRHILSSNQSILHSHGKNTMSVINKHNINSPVVRKGKTSPVLTGRSRNGIGSQSVRSPSPSYLGGNSPSPLKDQ